MNDIHGLRALYLVIGAKHRTLPDLVRNIAPYLAFTA